MIKYIALKNYGSILDATLHFTFEELKAPRGHHDFQTIPFIEIGNNRLVPSLALIGPNASGKTTFIRAFSAIHGFIMNGKNPYAPYKLRDNLLPTTKIKIAWLDKDLDVEYKYTIEAGKGGIIYESLDCDEETLFMSQNGLLSFPALNISSQDNKKILNSFKVFCVDEDTSLLLKSALEFLANDFPHLDSRVNNAYKFWNGKVVFYGLSSDNPSYSNAFTDAIKLLAETFTDVEPPKREESALELLSKYLKKLDFNIQKISYVRKKYNPDDFPFMDQIKHIYDGLDFNILWIMVHHLSESGESVPISFLSESNGTKRLMTILAHMLTAVRTGGVAVIDGIEESLHTHLVQELLKLFNDKDLNTQKSQIIFTTHNADLLSTGLRRSQIAVVSQRGFTGSTVRRLIDIPGVKQSDDFRADYLNGYYDALPAAYL